MRMNLIKAPGDKGSGALLLLREMATFPPQADHVLVVLFFGRGGTWGAALKPPDNSETSSQCLVIATESNSSGPRCNFLLPVRPGSPVL